MTFSVSRIAKPASEIAAVEQPPSKKTSARLFSGVIISCIKKMAGVFSGTFSTSVLGGCLRKEGGMLLDTYVKF